MTTNKNQKVLYTGFTDDIEIRILEHKNKVYDGFTKKFNVSKLVYYGEFKDMKFAKLREKQLKKYNRLWKENLINEMDPEWRDFYEDFYCNPLQNLR